MDIHWVDIWSFQVLNCNFWMNADIWFSIQNFLIHVLGVRSDLKSIPQTYSLVLSTESCYRHEDLASENKACTIFISIWSCEVQWNMHFMIQYHASSEDCIFAHVD